MRRSNMLAGPAPASGLQSRRTMVRRRTATVLVAVTLVAGGCAQEPASEVLADAPSGAPEVATRPATLEELVAYGLDEPGRIALLAQLAQDEPVVTLYSSSQGEVSEAIVASFRERFPEVSVQYVNMSTDDLLPRVVAEARAGRRTADVAFTSTAVLGELLAEGELALHHDVIVPVDQLRDLVHPRVNITRVELQTFAWNTDRRPGLTGPSDIDAVLEPQYSGCSLTDSPSWVSLLVQERGEAGARLWFERFLANGGQMATSTSRETRRLVLGEIDCLLLARESEIERLVEVDGAPLDWRTPTPTTVITHGVAVMEGSAAPFAAALLAWWVAQPEQVAVHLRASGGSGLHPGIVGQEGLQGSLLSPDKLTRGDIRALDPEEALMFAGTAFALIAEYITGNLISP